MKKVFLLDGFNFIFRSFYAIPDLARSDGFPTNALHGWVRTLWYLEDTYKPDRFVIYYDLGGAAQREALQPEYKSTRTEAPEALKQQIPVIKELSVAMGFDICEQEGVEADDLIGHYAAEFAKEGDVEVYIVSADKDLAQNVSHNVFQLLPPPTVNPRLGWRILDSAGVEKKFGVKTERIPDYLALVGDTSDNIAGIAGVGPKTAAKWLNQYGNIETIIANCGMLKPPRFQAIIHESADRLRDNLKMTTLESLENPAPISTFTTDLERLSKILQDMEMKKAYADANKRYGGKV